ARLADERKLGTGGEPPRTKDLRSTRRAELRRVDLDRNALADERAAVSAEWKAGRRRLRAPRTIDGGVRDTRRRHERSRTRRGGHRSVRWLRLTPGGVWYVGWTDACGGRV